MLTVKFMDGELVQNVDWKSLPNKPIRYMDYAVWRKTIRLMGYERYLRLKEMVYGVNVSLHQMSKIILVGQNGDMCTRIMLDLINKQCQKDNVLVNQVYNGKEIADNLWKPGCLDNPNVYIKDN